MRERDEKGKFLVSSARDFYGGIQTCKSCGEDKPCTDKNFRLNTRGGV